MSSNDPKSSPPEDIMYHMRNMPYSRRAGLLALAETKLVELHKTFIPNDNRCMVVKWTSFGEGPPLIFLHGTPWSSQLWAPIAKAFSNHFTVYMYDMPGYGASTTRPVEVAEETLTYPVQTETFCRILDHWTALARKDADDKELKFKPHIVAHDIGGHIALRARLMKDRDFASMTLVDCGASQPVDEPFFSLVRENTSVFTSLPGELHEALVRRYIRGASFKDLRQDQEDMLVNPWVGDQHRQELFYRQIKAQKNHDIRELKKYFKRLDIPLHIIWAKEDTWVPPYRAEILQKELGGTWRLIERSGHLIQIDAPEELMWHMSEWLRTVAGNPDHRDISMLPGATAPLPPTAFKPIEEANVQVEKVEPRAES